MSQHIFGHMAAKDCEKEAGQAFNIASVGSTGTIRTCLSVMVGSRLALKGILARQRMIFRLVYLSAGNATNRSIADRFRVGNEAAVFATTDSDLLDGSSHGRLL